MPEVKYFLEWVINVDVPAASSIYNNMEKKADTCFKALEKYMFGRNSDTVLNEIENELF